jgi:hypothetical protein
MKNAAHGLAVGCEAKRLQFAISVRVRAVSRWGAIGAAEQEPDALQEPGAIPDGLPVQDVTQDVPQVLAVTRAVLPAPAATQDVLHETQVQAVTQDEPPELHAFPAEPAEPALQPTSSLACFPAVLQVHCGLLDVRRVRCVLPDAHHQPARESQRDPQDACRHQSAVPQLRSLDAHGWR